MRRSLILPMLLSLALPLAALPGVPMAQTAGPGSTASRPGSGAAQRPPAPAASRPSAAQGTQASRQRSAAPPRQAPAQPSTKRRAAAAGAAAAAAAARPAPPQPAPEPEPEPAVGAVTGLPLPRFAPLRSDEVNMRAGPGTRFPIEWTYQRRDLPVEIVREFDQWRRIRDFEGTEGWVHQSNLGLGRRTFMIREHERTLRRRGEEGANAVARLSPGVTGRIRSCAAGSAWCEVQVGEHRGWLKRDEIFGVTPDEVIGQ
ncbi:hypothetical protein LPC08_06105 [Roseomonas sp. OT10]|uniref:SH3 domain-containing protein n=1 Tax=Roseomonas cutis TaxID=2897332 RepID=UPI001E656C1D|nr:SH3 domain-containing protein [Roseomonas sp. OT10]UFN50196.1 hypothetical protein LPC08_06105 [Roseomonas sp. OT10]